jgi:hypothetical protein
MGCPKYRKQIPSYLALLNLIKYYKAWCLFFLDYYIFNHHIKNFVLEVNES